MKDYNFVNVNDLNELEQQTSLKVTSFDDLKQKIILPINHKNSLGFSKTKCRSLCRKGHLHRKDQYD